MSSSPVKTCNEASIDAGFGSEPAPSPFSSTVEAQPPSQLSTSGSDYNLHTSTEALMPSSNAPQVWRHAAVEAIVHTEDQMLDLVAAGKELSIAQQSLRRSLHPLLEEAHMGQLKLSETLRQQTTPMIDSIVQLVKRIEEEMFNYAHEKTRHTMLLDLHGVSGSPVETPSYAVTRTSGLDATE